MLKASRRLVPNRGEGMAGIVTLKSEFLWLASIGSLQEQYELNLIKSEPDLLNNAIFGADLLPLLIVLRPIDQAVRRRIDRAGIRGQRSGNAGN